MQRSLLDVHVAWHTFLLRHGMDNEILQDWSRKIEHELRYVDHKFWIRLGFCCARRRADTGLPAPSLPNITEFSLLPSALIGHPMLGDLSQDKDSVKSPYPAVDVYDTRQQAIEGLKRRRDLYVVPSESVVGEAWKRKQKKKGGENLKTSGKDSILQ